MASNGTAVARLLRDIHLDAGISLDLQVDGQPDIVASALTEVLKERGTAFDAVDVRFGFDPLGIAATGGKAPSWDQDGARFAAQIAALAGQGYKGPFAVADGRAIHDAGGSEAQELAFAVAVALAYLRALEAGGIALEDARRMIYFPPRRRRRSVPDDGEIPRAAQAVGADRGGLRPCSPAGLRRGGNRVADDDASAIRS